MIEDKNEIKDIVKSVEPRPIVQAKIKGSKEPTGVQGFVMPKPPEKSMKKAIFKSTSNTHPALGDWAKSHKTVGYELNETTLLSELQELYGCLTIKECGDAWVSDGIGDDYMHWQSKKPVFISAQTGHGKNHFIEKVLIPYVYDLNYTNGKVWSYKGSSDKKILILSNRIALRKQINDRLGDIIGNTAEVFSYQFLEDNDLNWNKYAFAIFDECHFFTSDSMFNPLTDRILFKIVHNLCNAVRIYMSSTIDTCIRYIINKERRYERSAGNEVYIVPNFLYYKFNRDYSYLNIKYFRTFLDLNDIITESVESGDKWLIFLDNKDECQRLKDRLLQVINEESEQEKNLSGDDDNHNKRKKRSIMVIHSGSKGEKKYEEFVINEKFEESILISTSVIDNGINIKDSKVKNIVVTDINKDKVLQMLGRKRVDKGEVVNLYLLMFGDAHIEKLIRDLRYQKDAYHLYDLAYLNGTEKGKKLFINKFFRGTNSDFEKSKYWFYNEKNNLERLYPNEIARSLVENVLIERYEYILDRMKETGSGQELLEQQLSWFGSSLDKCGAVIVRGSDEAIAKFKSYSYSLLGKMIPPENKKKFSVEFSNEYIRAYGYRPEDKNKSRTRNEGYGSTVINKVFVDLSFDIKLETTKDGWSFTHKE